MAGLNSRFATISEADILKIHEDAVPEKTNKATKSVVEITEWVYTKAIILFNLGEYRQNIYLAASIQRNISYQEPISSCSYITSQSSLTGSLEPTNDQLHSSVTS